MHYTTGILLKKYIFKEDNYLLYPTLTNFQLIKNNFKLKSYFIKILIYKKHKNTYIKILISWRKNLIKCFKNSE